MGVINKEVYVCIKAVDCLHKMSLLSWLLEILSRQSGIDEEVYKQLVEKAKGFWI